MPRLLTAQIGLLLDWLTPSARVVFEVACGIKQSAAGIPHKAIAELVDKGLVRADKNILDGSDVLLLTNRGKRAKALLIEKAKGGSRGR